MENEEYWFLEGEREENVEWIWETVTWEDDMPIPQR